MDRDQTPIEKELEEAVYTDRVIVLLEYDDGFHQVCLTPKQFKAVCRAIAGKIDKEETDGLIGVSLLVGEETIPDVFFNGMQTHYTDEELDLETTPRVDEC